MTDKPSVLIIALSLRFGGAEVRVIETAALLHGKCQYGVVTLKDTPLQQKLQERGLNTFPLSQSKANPFILFSIYNIIKKGGFSVVDAHNPQSQLWGLLAALFARTPLIICTVHSSYGHTEKGIRKVLYELILKLNIVFDTAFLSVSEAVSIYLTGLGARRITLSPNGISIPETGRAGALREKHRAAFGLSKDDFVIISVGRLEPVKGHVYLIEAVSELRKAGKSVKCLIIGEGRYEETLKERITALGMANEIRLVGFRTDVEALLPMADVFCMPSLSEGLPYALLEACAVGLPIVASGVGGIAHFLKNMETAVLVKPENVPGLVEGIRYVMEKPQESKHMGMAGYALVKNRFSIESMHRLMLEVYGLS
ncbi:glycosyltransferase [Candidatus Magnetominusculus xianensis]|uniref:Glycosyl transferase n=1 Tax=Candidatus Magnetominusculus xianensis TaxID=1748249 RepID=A0ABR5SHR9_9BACT|nr:glycosyltransferase [Candidatus Magnetominusculus xianensis]KWT82977.1 glycosyl transferase [Candidatus Magnetominusculus xianensis]MBF0403056.1 glycosyltransferase [Nitrospirota bacterium]